MIAVQHDGVMKEPSMIYAQHDGVMKEVASGTLPLLGEAFGGGIFCGVSSFGTKPYALIAAPAASFTNTAVTYNPSTGYPWDHSGTSIRDGLVNRSAMIAAGLARFPAASQCESLSHAGFTDWYIPSVIETVAAIDAMSASGFAPQGILTTSSSKPGFTVEPVYLAWTTGSQLVQIYPWDSGGQPVYYQARTIPMRRVEL